MLLLDHGLLTDEKVEPGILVELVANQLPVEMKAESLTHLVTPLHPV